MITPIRCGHSASATSTREMHLEALLEPRPFIQRLELVAEEHLRGVPRAHQQQHPAERAAVAQGLVDGRAQRRHPEPAGDDHEVAAARLLDRPRPAERAADRDAVAGLQARRSRSSRGRRRGSCARAASGWSGSLDTLIGTSPTPKTPNMLICPGRKRERPPRLAGRRTSTSTCRCPRASRTTRRTVAVRVGTPAISSSVGPRPMPSREHLLGDADLAVGHPDRGDLLGHVDPHGAPRDAAAAADAPARAELVEPRRRTCA